MLCVRMGRGGGWRDEQYGRAATFRSDMCGVAFQRCFRPSPMHFRLTPVVVDGKDNVADTCWRGERERKKLEEDEEGEHGGGGVLVDGRVSSERN